MSLRLWVILFAVLFSLPVLENFYYLYDGQRILLVFSLVLLLFAHLQRLPLLTVSSASAYLLVALLGFISAVNSPVPAYAALEWGLFVAVVAGIVILSTDAADEGTLRAWVLPGIGIGVVLYGLIALMILFIAWDYEGSPLWPEPIHNFKNVRFLNQIQTWVLPLLPAILYSRLPKIRAPVLKALFFSYFVLFFALLFYTGGRGTPLALLSAMVLVVVLFRGPALKWSSVFVVCTVLGFGLSLLLFPSAAMEQTADRLVPDGLVYSPSGRLELWQLSLELILAHPWLGVGPMGFAMVSDHFGHPHNFPLQFTAEWGIPASLMLFALLAYAMFKWLRFARERVHAADCPMWEQMYIISLTAAMSSAGVHSLLSGIVVMPVSQTLLVLIPALALGWYRRYHKPAPGKPLTMHRVWAAVVLAAAVWLGGFTAAELMRYRDNEQAALAAGVGYQPRYWLHGRLRHHLEPNPNALQEREYNRLLHGADPGS